MALARDMETLKRFADAAGWHVEPGLTIPYGEQVVIRHSGQRAIANFWPKRGTLSIQGPASPLLDDLKAWQRDPSGDKTGGSKSSLELPHIGIDESGKGDWFGPLVVAAVELDTRTAELLRVLGVRDSKRVGPAAIGELAAQIEQVVDDAHRHVLVLSPLSLNRTYASQRNINLVLAGLHAQAADAIWRRTGTALIISDQFASAGERLDAAFVLRGVPKPVQLHHAEDASTAVAAASVLATASFRSALSALGTRGGLAGPLPAGASDIPALEKTLTQLRTRFGVEAIDNYAKTFFKPVRERLGLPLSVDLA